MLFTVSAAVAQIFGADYDLRRAGEWFDYIKKHSGTMSEIMTHEIIDGSPYLNDEFIDGTVFTTFKTKFTDIPLRYNIYSDQIEFESDKGVLVLASPETVEVIEFNEKQFEYVPYSIANRIKRGFFIVEERGNATLYIKPRVTFQEAKKPAAYQDAVPAQFIKRPDEFYIRAGENPAMLISTKKDLENVFPDYQKEVSEFMKKNKTKPKDLESLKELVNYYNSL